jgi:transcriptional regulator of aroF, aroG, tyrA and aromatic amino acid transport
MYLQAKLLRVIQEGSIRKIGSNKEEYVDVRIISATNKKLEEMIANKAFREDLYYRLNVIPMYIPKLSERLEDIPSLVQFFINKFNKKMKKNVKGVELEFINELMQYYWPGNVRELQNVIERAMNLCEGNILTKKELMIEFGAKNDISINTTISYKANEQLSLKELMDQCEKEIIRRALSSNKSCRKTAKLLRVSHTTIINKVKKYGIEV